LQTPLQSSADVIGCETVPNVADVQALTRLANEQALNKDLWLSMVCRDGRTLSSGESIEEATRALLEEDVDRAVTAIGVNCTAPHFVSSLLETLADMETGRILMAYPNRGEAWCSETQQWDHVRSFAAL
jgi:homocysteine S-methyltransferase